MNKKITLSVFTFFLTSLATVSSQQIFTNGSISTGTVSTNSTTAPAGYSWSELQAPLGTLGFSGYYNTAQSNNFALADDFVVPVGETWNISSLEFLGYQTSYAGATIPIDGLRVQIWNGDPSLGTSTVVAGDMTTNVLHAASSGEEFVYRTATATSTARKVWKFTASLTASLPAGTYWVEYQVHAINDAAIFLPPVTILNTSSNPAWNAKQRTATTWANLIDTGNASNLSLPFRINGAILGLGSNAFSSKIAIYPNPVQNNLILSNPIVSSETSIEIYDLTGRKVKSIHPKYESELTLDVQDLQAGNYVLKITTENGIAVKKFIKN